jgi:hypothetical protein
MKIIAFTVIIRMERSSVGMHMYKRDEYKNYRQRQFTTLKFKRNSRKEHERKKPWEKYETFRKGKAASSQKVANNGLK